MAVGETPPDATLTAALSSPNRAAPQASARLLVRDASTGARPVLAAADNGKSYWLKWPGNPHGNLSLAHELIVARIGEVIGAPVRPTCLVFVDQALVESYYIDGQRLPSGLYVGSELLPDVEEHTSISRVARDGNAQRFPHYLALWDLCLGTDLQLLFHLSEHHQVWSIDHGLWFDSQEGDWTSDLLSARVNRPWPWPAEELPNGLDDGALVAAADAVGGLTMENLAGAIGCVPLEWGISDGALRTLALFVYDRRSVVAKRLRDVAELMK
jgi:HipA-like protein